MAGCFQSTNKWQQYSLGLSHWQKPANCGFRGKFHHFIVQDFDMRALDLLKNTQPFKRLCFFMIVTKTRFSVVVLLYPLQPIVLCLWYHSFLSWIFSVTVPTCLFGLLFFPLSQFGSSESDWLHRSRTVHAGFFFLLLILLTLMLHTLVSITYTS